MFGGIAKSLFGSSNDRYVKSIMKIVGRSMILNPKLKR